MPVTHSDLNANTTALLDQIKGAEKILGNSPTYDQAVDLIALKEDALKSVNLIASDDPDVIQSSFIEFKAEYRSLQINQFEKDNLSEADYMETQKSHDQYQPY